MYTVTTDKTPRTIESVEMACDIVEILRETGGATVTEIGDQVDLSLGSVYTHLATLRENNYVMKDGDQYELSPRFVTLGEHVRNHSELYNAGTKKADEIAEETGEAVNLMSEYNGLKVILYQAFGQNAAGTEYHVRNREEPKRYLHYSASGKAMLAEFSEEKVQRIIDEHGLERRTDNTITNPEQLFENLETVSERGFALNDEEQVNGLRAVGAAIEDPDGNVVGAISLSAPKHRMRGEKFREEVPDLVTNTANLIELNLQTREGNLG